MEDKTLQLILIILNGAISFGVTAMALMMRSMKQSLDKNTDSTHSIEVDAGKINTTLRHLGTSVEFNSAQVLVLTQQVTRLNVLEEIRTNGG